MLFVFFTSLSFLVGLLYSIKNDDKLSSLWLAIAFVGYHLTWLGTWKFLDLLQITMVGILIWFFGAIAFLIKYLIRKDISYNEKLLIAAFGGVTIIPTLFRFMHWPGSVAGYVFGIIPVLFFAILIATKSLKVKGHLTPYIVFIPICVLNFILIASNWFN